VATLLARTHLLQHFQIGTAHSGFSAPVPDILVAAERGSPGKATRVRDHCASYSSWHWAPLVVRLAAGVVFISILRRFEHSQPFNSDVTLSPITRPHPVFFLCTPSPRFPNQHRGPIHLTNDISSDSCAAPPELSPPYKVASYTTPPESPLGYRALEPPFSLQLKSRLGGMENGRYASQQGTRLPPQASYPVVSASDRYRQAPLTASAPPASASSSGSRASPSGYGYAYGEGSQFGSSIQPSPVQYGAQDYGTGQQQSPQRASQQYSPYGQNVMYGVGGAQGSATGTSQYEPVEQYQQNRDSAIQVLSTGFGVAQAPYYESGPTSAPASALASQNVPSQYPSLGYTAPQASVGRETLAPAFTSAGMTDPNQATAHAGYAQGNYGEQPSTGNEFDVFYNRYQTELKRTFEHVRDGRLNEAAQQLFMLSDWVLHYAETLGESI
jgi:hypothetical protein